MKAFQRPKGSMNVSIKLSKIDHKNYEFVQDAFEAKMKQSSNFYKCSLPNSKENEGMD